MNNVLRPDLSSTPLKAIVTRKMAAPAAVLFRAWTKGIDHWLAVRGSVLLTPEVNSVFYFQTQHGEFRAPYYGRFLRVERNRLLEFAWVSLGTGGAETTVALDFQPEGPGCRLRLVHSGFNDASLRNEHAKAWRKVLTDLDAYTKKKPA
jgi:uncharacterized protein YndB with AHSA1/START domain